MSELPSLLPVERQLLLPNIISDDPKCDNEWVCLPNPLLLDIHIVVIFLFCWVRPRRRENMRMDTSRKCPGTSRGSEMTHEFLRRKEEEKRG